MDRSVVIEIARKWGPHEARTAHWGPDAEWGDSGAFSRRVAPSTNRVVRERARFKSAAHRYLSNSCLL